MDLETAKTRAGRLITAVMLHGEEVGMTQQEIEEAVGGLIWMSKYIGHLEADIEGLRARMEKAAQPAAEREQLIKVLRGLLETCRRSSER